MQYMFSLLATILDKINGTIRSIKRKQSQRQLMGMMPHPPPPPNPYNVDLNLNLETSIKAAVDFNIAWGTLIGNYNVFIVKHKVLL